MAVMTQNAVVSTSSSGDNTVVAAVAGKRVVVVGYKVVNNVATAQAVIWKSGSTALTGTMALASAIGGDQTAFGADDVQPVFFTAVGAALVLNLSAATSVGGHVSFYYS